MYNNENFLYGTPSGSNDGDSQYDHIVTVIGVETTTAALNVSTYLATDVLLIQDHGLATNVGTGQGSQTFRLKFGSCVLSRSAANLDNGPIYSLSAPTNYGFAVTGVMPTSKALPLTVEVTSVNCAHQRPGSPCLDMLQFLVKTSVLEEAITRLL